MFGGYIGLLHQDSVGIVLTIARNHGVCALRPHGDPACTLAASVTLLAEGPTVVDLVVQNIELPELAPDRDTGAAGHGNDIPIRRDHQRSQTSDGIRGIADD